MTAREELAARLARCERMPFGRERVLLAEEVVAAADAAGDVALSVAARHVLIPSYIYGPAAEPPKIFAAFTWNLARWDDSPDAFDELERHHVLWYFKWVTAHVLRYPQVPLAQVEQSLADMRERYLRAGEGLAPYEGCRYLQHAHRFGDHDERTTQAFHAWTVLPRTDLSDCRACEPSVVAGRQVALGLDEDAVATALPVVENGGCREQPQGVLDAAIGALLRTGREATAVEGHALAVRRHRRDGEHGDLHAQVLVSAQVGRHGRGLDLLESVLHTVESGTVPMARMRLAASGARLLAGLEAAGHGDEPVRADLGGTAFAQPRAAREVLADLRAVALDLAGRFDARNGTDAVSAAVHAVLDAPDLPDVGTWSRTARGRLDRRPAGPAAAAAPAARVPDDAAAPAGAGPDDPFEGLVARRERCALSGDVAGWDDLAARWPAVRDRLHATAPDVVRDRAADVALLDLAVARHALARGTLDDVPANLAALGLAADALRAAGRTAEALLVDLQRRCVDGVRAAAGGASDLLGTLHDAERLAGDVEATGDRGAAALARAEVALLADRLVDARGADATDLPVRAQRLCDEAAAHLEMLPGADLSGAERGRYALVQQARAAVTGPEEGLARLDRALAVLPPGTRAFERALVLETRASLLDRLDRPEEAVAALDEAAGDALRGGRPELHVECLLRAGSALLDLDRPAEAAERLGRGLDAAGPDDPVTWPLLAQLTLALGRAGRALDAAEVAETTARRLAAAVPPNGAEAFQAGRAAFLGAAALHALDERPAAARLALESARVHAGHPEPGPRAEALGLAADCTDDATARVRLLREAVDLLPAADDPWFAAELRRRLADAVEDADGPDPALALLTALVTDLEATDPPPGEEDALTWNLVAARHLQAGVLLRAGRAAAAAEAAVELDAVYAALGDDDNAARALGLRAQALAALGRTDEAVALARGGADEALGRGAAGPARQLGLTLARILDEAGDPDAAEAAWQRYGGT